MGVTLFDAFAVITPVDCGATGWTPAAEGVVVTLADHCVAGNLEPCSEPTPR